MIWLVVIGLIFVVAGWYYKRSRSPSPVEDDVSAPIESTPVVGAEKQGNEVAVFVQRLPILNNQQQVIGYEVIPEVMGKPSSRSGIDDLPLQASLDNFRAAIAMVSSNDVAELGSGKKIYVNVSGDVLESEEILLFPADNTVLIVGKDANHEHLLEPCKLLKDKGYQFSVSTKGCVDKNHALLDVASFVVIDDSEESDDIQDWIQALRGKKLRIVVSNIQNQEQFERIKKMGVNAYQGFYFSEPETLDNAQVGTQVEHIMNIFNLVNSKAEPEKIEQAFKLDPNLSFNLLRYINSAGFGMRNEVSSIKAALVFLGHEKLARWLGVLLVMSKDVDSNAQDALFDLATRRARLMELLGDKSFSEAEKDGLFMTGIFSLLETLLGMPMDKIVANLNLPEAVLDALLQQKGRYYEVLNLAVACEQSSLEIISPLAEKLGLDPMIVNSKQLEANQWANSLKAA